MTLFSALADVLQNIVRGLYSNFYDSKPASVVEFINGVYKLISKYSPAVMLPISAVVGLIGYKIENWISDKYTPSLKSVKEKRDERLLNEEKEVESLKEHQFVPKTIFEKNLSPSLKEPDPRLKKYSEKSS